MKTHPLNLGAALCVAATLLTPTLGAQQELTRFTGDLDGAELSGVAYVGDVNGDGVGEYAIAAPRRASGALAEAGRVQLIDGSDHSVLWTVDGASAYERLGHDLAAVHDADGDGVPDLAVGAPAGPLSSSAGRVLLLSGDDGSVIQVLTGTEAGGEFGRSLAAVYDLDGDALPELIVGAPSQDAGGSERGGVYVLDPLTGAVFSSLSGLADGDRLGSSVAGSGSLAAQGPWKMNDTPTPIIGFEVGSLPAAGAPQESTHGTGYVVTLNPLTGAAVAIETGNTANDRFGTVTASIGDLDGDGYSELFMASDPRTSPENPTGEGYTRLVDGTNGQFRTEIPGTEFGNNYGIDIVGTGDVDGDGVPDYLVGEARDDTAGEDAGRVLLHSGADHSVLAVIHGESAGELFGAHVGAVGDLDGDGLAEFAASAPQAAGGKGVVRVFKLSTP